MAEDRAGDREEREPPVPEVGAAGGRAHRPVGRGSNRRRGERTDVRQRHVGERRGGVEGGERAARRAGAHALPASRRPEPADPELRILGPGWARPGEHDADEQGDTVEGPHGLTG